WPRHHSIPTHSSSEPGLRDKRSLPSAKQSHWPLQWTGPQSPSPRLDPFPYREHRSTERSRPCWESLEDSRAPADRAPPNNVLRNRTRMRHLPSSSLTPPPPT